MSAIIGLRCAIIGIYIRYNHSYNHDMSAIIGLRSAIIGIYIRYNHRHNHDMSARLEYSFDIIIDII